MNELDNKIFKSLIVYILNNKQGNIRELGDLFFEFISNEGRQLIHSEVYPFFDCLRDEKTTTQERFYNALLKNKKHIDVIGLTKRFISLEENLGNEEKIRQIASDLNKILCAGYISIELDEKLRAKFVRIECNINPDTRKATATQRESSNTSKQVFTKLYLGLTISELILTIVVILGVIVMLVVLIYTPQEKLNSLEAITTNLNI